MEPPGVGRYQNGTPSVEYSITDLSISQSFAVEYHLRTCGQPELHTKNMAYTVAKPIQD